MGNTGIAHTRWATHGEPNEINAHPHFSENKIAVVHNGIIENYEQLRQELIEKEFVFDSDTDTEVIAHLISHELKSKNDFLTAVRNAISRLKGAFAIAVINQDNPNQIIAARLGSPLVIGMGIGENFVASDTLALLPFTQKFIFLNDGDIAVVSQNNCSFFDKKGAEVSRKIYHCEATNETASRGEYRHFMQKEIFEQPSAITATLESCLSFDDGNILPNVFGYMSGDLFDATENIQITACGTSCHAALVARYWLEEIAQIPCQVEIASELRYRKKVIPPNTLFVTLSQSGETADTLAALRQAKTLLYIGSLAICNVAESSLVRESDTAFLTRAGVEIGVCSTKAFTTQLLALLVLTLRLSKKRCYQE